MLKDLVTKNRTYRRFYQEKKISRDELLDLIELARLTSTGANLQPMKYILSYTGDKNELIFEELKWAAYLKDWEGPVEGERPAAYIIMVMDKEISTQAFWNHGLAAQSILLGAVEKGYGGCMFAGFDKDRLRKKLSLPEQFDPLMVIALGEPKEIVVLEDMDTTGDVKYWRDEKSVHHVPKRKLEDLVLSL